MKNAVLKKVAAVTLAAAMVFTVAPVVNAPQVTAEAATKKAVKLSKKSLKITEQKGYKLSVKNTAKKAKIKWSSSDKKVVTVKAAKNKKSATVTPVATTGSAIVTAKVGKKKYNCKVTVDIAQAAKENHFSDLKAAIEAKGVAGAVTGTAISGKVIASPETTIPVTFDDGLQLNLTGSLIVASADKPADTIAFAVDGKTSYLMQDLTGTAVVTLNKDKKIENVLIEIKDATGKDAIKVASKAGTSIDATKFTKTSVPAELADAVEVSGQYAGLITDKTKLSKGILDILSKVDAYMNTTLGYGLSSIGFDNY